MGAPAKKADYARRASPAWGLLLLMVSSIRLGFIDHHWMAAVVVDALVVLSIPALLLILRRRDMRLALRRPGALFVAGGNVVLGQLAEQARFAPSVARVRHSWVGGGYLAGDVVVCSEAIHFEPSKNAGFGAERLTVPMSDVDEVEVRPVRGKFDVGLLHVLLKDGSQLDLEVAHRKRLMPIVDALLSNPKP